jgi:hypothetical protein
MVADRVVPITQLRRRYIRLKSPGVSTEQRQRECGALVADAAPLVCEFVSAIGDWRTYDNRLEDFYPRKGRRIPKSRGAVVVTDLLSKNGPLSVPALQPYAFRYLHREVSPFRTTRGHFDDGTLASRSGLGGIDYVALLEAQPAVPILGEIKVGGDADAYYAFVQLLTYLSELSSEAQTARASQLLFDGVVGFPARYDLHILLADYNDRGKKGPLVEATRSLVARFRAALSSTQAPQVLGRVLCLRMNTKAFTGSLDLLWCVTAFGLEDAYLHIPGRDPLAD